MRTVTQRPGTRDKEGDPGAKDVAERTELSPSLSTLAPSVRSAYPSTCL